MPNRAAKLRKQERRKKNKILERTGRTPAQIKRFERRGQK
tara:strand:- start:1073 stop:1192 length:120 start_codon:yes stop_codon:yes gene_type:complete